MSETNGSIDGENVVRAVVSAGAVGLDADLGQGQTSSRSRALKALSAVEEQLLVLRDVYRVLTTGQVMRFTDAAERTTEYRLARLAERGLVGRLRPRVRMRWSHRRGGRHSSIEKLFHNNSV